MSVRRLYETTFIVNAALEDPDVEAVITKVSNYIENHGGEILEIQRWGRRRLAYPINKKYNGYYVHCEYNTMSNTVPVVERFLVLEDTILRHLTLELSEKLRDFRRNRTYEEGRQAALAEEPDVMQESQAEVNVPGFIVEKESPTFEKELSSETDSENDTDSLD